MLQNIRQVVNLNNKKQLVCWVALVVGFHLFPMKDNLVLESEKQLQPSHVRRIDFASHGDVLMATFIQTKTAKFAVREIQVPMIRNAQPIIFPVYWFLHVVNTIHAKPFNHAFIYHIGTQLKPLTARVLLKQFCTWLTMVGENAQKISLHSLRKGVLHLHSKRNYRPCTLSYWGIGNQMLTLDILTLPLIRRLETFCPLITKFALVVTDYYRSHSRSNNTNLENQSSENNNCCCNKSQRTLPPPLPLQDYVGSFRWEFYRVQRKQPMHQLILTGKYNSLHHVHYSTD